MDVPLYSTAILVFGVLYLAIGVFWVFSLVITLVILYLYLALRYGHLPEGYPHSATETLITTVFIGVTWAIFTFLAPKTPLPLVGIGFTYTNSPVPVTALLEIGIALAIGFLALGAFVKAQQERGKTGTAQQSAG